MPSTVAPITDELIHSSIVSAVRGVCATMLKFDASFLQKTLEPDNEPFKAQPHVFGCVGFVGKVDGVVHLCITRDFAIHAASTLLGMTEAELQSDQDTVKDVVGEITNMTVGTFKNGICDLGFQCKVTLPTVLRGSQLKVESTANAKRWTFDFTVMDRPFVADLFIQDDNSAA